MKIGVIQGRLTEPVDGHIQEFPKKKWKEEFNFLRNIGLNHIEWLVTGKTLNNNPIFKEDLIGYPINSICADNMVNKRFTEMRFLKKNLIPICEAARRNKVEFVTIPLLEDSNINDPDTKKKFLENFLEVIKDYNDINFSFEMESERELALEIAELQDNFWLTYDTGNITSGGHSHLGYIEEVYHKINNVHLKDRTWEGQTVKLGTGNTNFTLILNKLNEVGYDNLYTLQTARETAGLECETIIRHKRYFDKMCGDIK